MSWLSDRINFISKTWRFSWTGHDEERAKAKEQRRIWAEQEAEKERLNGDNLK